MSLMVLILYLVIRIIIEKCQMARADAYAREQLRNKR